MIEDGSSGCKPDVPDPPEEMDFETELSKVSCACGFGYFKPDKTWVSGADVRHGRAPPQPASWDDEPIKK
jgi:hypothetical protein